MKKLVLTLALMIVPAVAASAQDLKTVTEGVGFGGVVVGKSTMADVKKKFGKNYQTIQHKKYSTQLKYPGGLSFYFCQADKKQQVFDIELRAPFKAKTSKGIVLSESTVEQVRKAYGKPIEADTLQFRGVSFFYASNKGRKVVTVIDIVEKSGIRQCAEAK